MRRHTERSERSAGSCSAFDTAIQLDPEDLYASNGIGDVCRCQGRFREAVMSYQKSLDLVSNDGHALLYKAECHWRLGEVHLAGQILNKIVQNIEDELWIEKAELLYEKLELED